tara:strand:+ start:151 stop:1524 length:1374 start_codon:yes stop_codon:yes gene_type:complete
MLKNSLCFFVFFGVLLCTQDWAVKYQNKVWSQQDFYRFFPKNDWLQVDNKEKKDKILTSFLKQNVAAYNAEVLGLNFSPEVAKKISARYNMLMVNEYYMRHFLGSVIPSSALFFCGQHLKNEVFVKHILLKHVEGLRGEASPVFQRAQNIKDSLLSFGVSFEGVAISFSEDPSVTTNKGGLGWLSIGKTVPEFEKGVFGLCVGCLGVLETDFGFHVVRVDSLRPSMYASLSQEEYDDFVFRFSSSYIKGPLKDLAAQHDSLLVRSAGVVFDFVALTEIVELIDEELRLKFGDRRAVDVLKILRDYPGIIMKYNSNLFGGGWFAQKIERSLHSSVFYASVDEIYKDFLTVVLRDIVYQKGLDLGLNRGFSFVNQYFPVRLGVLEKAYLSFLVSSVEVPTDEEIKLYFRANSEGKDLNVAYNSIETILLQQKQEEVKSSFFEAIENRKNIIINEVWFGE